MAVLACASRFAVLKLEDDEVSEKSNASLSQAGTQSEKNKSNVKGGSNDKAKSKKKKKSNNEIAELQSLAFASHSAKLKNKASSNSVKVINPSQKQWEEWQAKDSELMSEIYEQDLQQALLMSKIDFEEKKEVYDALSKEAEQQKLGLNKKKKKTNQKKVKGIMSLDEFQSLGSADIDSRNYQKGTSNAELDDFEVPPKTVTADEANFFDRIEEDAEKIISKEQKHEQLKALDNPVIESARLAQCQEDSRKKDEKIALLKEMVLKLKEELKNVKSRNKKLYGILETGEMREKAEILVQVDELTLVRDELTEQVNELHTALEQERSKVHALQTDLKKYQNNRKQRTDSK